MADSVKKYEYTWKITVDGLNYYGGGPRPFTVMHEGVFGEVIEKHFLSLKMCALLAYQHDPNLKNVTGDDLDQYNFHFSLASNDRVYKVNNKARVTVLNDMDLAGALHVFGVRAGGVVEVRVKIEPKVINTTVEALAEKETGTVDTVEASVEKGEGTDDTVEAPVEKGKGTDGTANAAVEEGKGSDGTIDASAQNGKGIDGTVDAVLEEGKGNAIITSAVNYLFRRGSPSDASTSK